MFYQLGVKKKGRVHRRARDDPTLPIASKMKRVADMTTPGIPEWTLTIDLLLRRQSLYPTELRIQIKAYKYKPIL